MEHHFGVAPDFALGIEEELLLVDPDTLQLANVASALVEEMGGAVVNDLYEALIETSTPIVASAPEGVEHLAALRARLRSAGATFLGAGLHPDAAFGDVELVQRKRYAQIHGEMRGLVERTPTAALHVHVGLPDPETAIAVHNRLRAYLPLLQALAAHSPFWHGRDAGLASARALVFRAFPRAAIPPAFRDWEDYAELVARCVAAGDLPDHTHLWWDIRPSPGLGTVEVRAMDAQSRLATVAGLAALVHALAAACADGAQEPPLPTEALEESSFRAARDGVDATIYWRGALRPIAAVAHDALALARPYAHDLDGEDALEEIERVLREGGGANRMRAAHAAGGMPGLLAALARETYGSTQTTSPIRSQS
ncbi:MAG TPA: YbdK family carboxylate-amine ligase [Solirubrobacter sp.]|nr:YbdK family carboxylate-amine ligase [Solirubrobacter sp.]